MANIHNMRMLPVSVPKCFSYRFCPLRKKLGKTNVVGQEMPNLLRCNYLFYFYLLLCGVVGTINARGVTST